MCRELRIVLLPFMMTSCSAFTASYRQQRALHRSNHPAPLIQRQVIPGDGSSEIGSFNPFGLQDFDPSSIANTDASSIWMSSSYAPAHPIVQNGKVLQRSIHPTPRGMKELGLSNTKSAAELIPTADEATQAQLQKALDNGYGFIDMEQSSDRLKAMPGFVAPHGIFGEDTDRMPVPYVSDEMVLMSMKNVMSQSRVFEKLPLAAFVYVLVEFFILRPGVDLYKEDIEEDPAGVFMESVVVGGVRLVSLFIIAIMTGLLFH